jgi:hypothetical protein
MLQHPISIRQRPSQALEVTAALGESRKVKLESRSMERASVPVAAARLILVRPMRVFCTMVLIAASAAVAGSQPTVTEAMELGQRVLKALFEYPKPSLRMNVLRGRDLLTTLPTIEVLHAGGYISDSDVSLCHRYHVALHPIPAGASQAQPMLTMETNRGELVFDTSGDCTLGQHK